MPYMIAVSLEMSDEPKASDKVHIVGLKTFLLLRDQNGLTSVYYVVGEIPEDWNEDTPIGIVNDHSAAEVLLSELLVLRWVKP